MSERNGSGDPERVPVEAVLRRAIHHEAAHVAAARCFNWRITRVYARAGEDGWADVRPVDGRDRLRETVEWIQVLLVGDLWVRTLAAHEPERYGYRHTPPTEEQLTAAPLGSGEPERAAFAGFADFRQRPQTDLTDAETLANDVAATPSAAAALVNYAAAEAVALVASERFQNYARLVAELLERNGGDLDGLQIEVALGQNPQATEGGT